MDDEEGGIHLAIVGARTMRDHVLFEATINEFIQEHVIHDVDDADDAGAPIRASIVRVISGGARGADTMGERWARERGIPVKLLIPLWRDPERGGAYNPRAGLDRNTDIIRECTHVLAFPR